MSNQGTAEKQSSFQSNNNKPTRREFLRGLGLAGAFGAVNWFLAACGISPATLTPASPEAPTQDQPPATATPEPTRTTPPTNEAPISENYPESLSQLSLLPNDSTFSGSERSSVISVLNLMPVFERSSDAALTQISPQADPFDSSMKFHAVRFTATLSTDRSRWFPELKDAEGNPYLLIVNPTIENPTIADQLVAPGLIIDHGMPLYYSPDDQQKLALQQVRLPEGVGPDRIKLAYDPASGYQIWVIMSKDGTQMVGWLPLRRDPGQTIQWLDAENSPYVEVAEVAGVEIETLEDLEAAVSSGLILAELQKFLTEGFSVDENPDEGLTVYDGFGSSAPKHLSRYYYIRNSEGSIVQLFDTGKIFNILVEGSVFRSENIEQLIESVTVSRTEVPNGPIVEVIVRKENDGQGLEVNPNLPGLLAEQFAPIARLRVERDVNKLNAFINTISLAVPKSIRWVDWSESQVGILPAKLDEFRIGLDGESNSIRFVLNPSNQFSGYNPMTSGRFSIREVVFSGNTVILPVPETRESRNWIDTPFGPAILTLSELSSFLQSADGFFPEGVQGISDTVTLGWACVFFPGLMLFLSDQQPDLSTMGNIISSSNDANGYVVKATSKYSSVFPGASHSLLVG